jgi:uncharacterized protein YqgC (DUF456 family)
MPEWGVLLVAVACAVGIAGTVVPILPGTLVVGAAVCVWAAVEGGWDSWSVALLAVGLLAVGQLLKYVIAGRALSAGGVPTLTMVAGGVLGLVGFFVIPVVGLVVGFVGGVFLAELVRLRDPREAWPSTLLAMKAAGIATLIELGAALLATSVWAAGVLLT